MTIDEKFEKAKAEIDRQWNSSVVFYQDKGSTGYYPFHGELRKIDGTFIKRIIIRDLHKKNHHSLMR